MQSLCAYWETALPPRKRGKLIAFTTVQLLFINSLHYNTYLDQSSMHFQHAVNWCRHAGFDMRASMQARWPRFHGYKCNCAWCAHDSEKCFAINACINAVFATAVTKGSVPVCTETAERCFTLCILERPHANALCDIFTMHQNLFLWSYIQFLFPYI